MTLPLYPSISICRYQQNMAGCVVMPRLGAQRYNSKLWLGDESYIELLGGEGTLEKFADIAFSNCYTKNLNTTPKWYPMAGIGMSNLQRLLHVRKFCN